MISWEGAVILAVGMMINSMNGMNIATADKSAQYQGMHHFSSREDRWKRTGQAPGAC